MELYKYKMLSDTGQWNELWSNGKHLDSLIYPESKFSLYALHRFFVEVEISNKNKILGKTEFKAGKRMDKFIGTID